MDYLRSFYLAYPMIVSILLSSSLTSHDVGAWRSEGVQASATSSTTLDVFEIISIKPSNPEKQDRSMRILPDGFRNTGMSLETLVDSAYGIINDNQVVGMPSWAGSEPYDVEAKVDAGTAERWKKLTLEERWKQEQPMLQALLADRCKLRVHFETKQLPVYELVIAKGGLKMKGAEADEKESEELSGGKLIGRGMSTGSIVYALSGTDGRLIVDKTGLGERRFDFDLQWTPESGSTATDSGPSLFTALEEQLGLKLVPSKGPVKILVIDHMEKPSPN